MKYVLITHDDLDGAGCEIVMREYIKSIQSYNKFDLEVYHCNVIKCGEAIEKVYKESNIEQIIIADISPKEQKHLDMIGESNITTILFDHHQTAEDRFKTLNVPRNMIVNFDCNNRCGTKLLADQLVLGYDLDDFAYVIDDYDRFQLKDSRSLKLNQLFLTIGMERFVKRGVNSSLSEQEEYALSLIDIQSNNYIRDKLDSIKFMKIADKKIATIFTDSKLTSIIAKTMREQHIDCDALAVINLNTNEISLRSIAADFNCGELARIFDTKGGGHAGASSFRLNYDYFKDVENKLIDILGGKINV